MLLPVFLILTNLTTLALYIYSLRAEEKEPVEKNPASEDHPIGWVNEVWAD